MIERDGIERESDFELRNVAPTTADLHTCFIRILRNVLKNNSTNSEHPQFFTK